MLITHLFFTSTHPLLLLQFIILYFYLDFISSTCLPLLNLISFQISKRKSSPYFGQLSHGHPKVNSKSLRNSREKKKKKKEKEEEHQRNTDVVETTKKNGKLSRKETKIHDRCIRSWNLLRNYLRWVKNYKEIRVSISGRYPFSSWNPVFRSVLPEHFRYCWYLNQYEMRSFLYRSRHRYGKYWPYRLVRYKTDYTKWYLEIWENNTPSQTWKEKIFPLLRFEENNTHCLLFMFIMKYSKFL